MTSIRELKELGVELGYEGEGLRQFVKEEIERAAQERDRAEERASQERAELRETQEREARERAEERENRERERIAQEKERAAERAVQEKAAKRAEALQNQESENARLALEVERERIRVDGELARRRLDLEENRPDGTTSIESTPVIERKGILPKMPAFDETVDDIDAFLQRFVVYAKSANWDEEVWAISLASLLKGRALSIYHQLTVDEACNFQEVKNALLRGFDCTKEGCRTKFRASKLMPGETAQQYAARLKKLFEKWLAMSRCKEEYEDLKDFMLQEQFFRGCEPALCVHLRERNLTTLQALVDVADLYIEARAGSGSNRTSGGHKPGGGMRKFLENHSKVKTVSVNPHREMSRPQIVCYNCLKPGHRANDCYRLRSASNGGSKSFQKPNTTAVAQVVRRRESDRPSENRGLNRFGSRRNTGVDVLNKKTGASVIKVNPMEFADDHGWIRKGGKGFQVVCGGVSAIDRGLITAKGTVEGRQVMVMRDTGCTTVLVRTDFVPKSKYTGAIVNVIMADSTVKSFPEAEIEIESPFYNGTCKAAVMETPLYDLIIGTIAGVKEIRNIEGKKFHNKGKGKGVSNKKQSKKPERTCAVETRAQLKRELDDKRSPKLKVPQVSKVWQQRDIGSAQKEDTTLKRIFNFATEGRIFHRKGGNEVSRYEVKQNKLYRIVECQGKAKEQLVIPAKFRKEILSLAHDGLMGGHLGSNKTRERILDKFFWPGLTLDVHRFCRSCDKCQRTVEKGRVQKVELGKMPIIEEPFSRVAIDLIGPVEPRADDGSRYILTIVDFATRYPEAKALRKVDTVSVAEALVEVFSRTGLPKEILSDRGTQFTSELMEEVCRLLRVKMLHTTPYHAMCNGLVEKFNGTLKNMLRKMISEQPKQWPRYIAPLLFAYREVPQKSTGFAPFELIFGHTVRGPLSLLRELWEDEPEEEVRHSYEYVLNLRDRLKETLLMATEELKKNQEIAKHYYDRKTCDRMLNVGQKVLLLLPCSSNKLLCQWKGPFEVTKKCNRWNYVIDMNGVERKYHINMLRRYWDRDENVTNCEMASVVMELKGDMEEEELVVPTVVATENWQNVKMGKDLSKEQVEALRGLLKQHGRVLTDVPGRTTETSCRINLTSQQVVRMKSYPIPFNLVEEVKNELKIMKEFGVIEKSNSAFNSPLCIAKKKDGKLRLCLDLRELNKIVEFDAEPMCDSEEIFVKLANSRYFSKLDLTKGYWQIPIDESSRKYTAFATPEGLFQFTVLPFGLVNAPAYFNRLMRKLFGDMTSVEVFLDDILIHTRSWEDHLIVMKEVLARLGRANISARPSKCEVGSESLVYLGHEIGGGLLKPTQDKVAAIANAKIPKTKKEVRSFIGLASYYRRFIPDFATMSAPLTDLTKKSMSNSVVWTDKEQQSFDSIRECLMKEPILTLVDLSKLFYLQTDASGTGIGAVLLQEKFGVKLPVYYASRKLSQSEQKYATIERECLAVVWATKKFYQYLYGRNFVIETDHQPLTYLKSAKTLNGRLMRWSLHLQQFQYTIGYVKGSENVIADCLSRSVELDGNEC